MKKRLSAKGMERLKPVSEERILMGSVIAEREYRSGSGKILVQVGTPRPASWQADWYCPFRVVFGGEERVRAVFGVDSIQALMLVFEVIKATLEALFPDIEWEGGERPGDVGIQRRLTSALGFEFCREMEEVLDKAYAARTRHLEREAKKQARRKTPRR